MNIKIISIILFIGSLNASAPINYLNHIRQKCGLIPLKENSKLSYAAKKHAEYVDINKEYSHYEINSNPNFFESTPWNRIVKAGYKTKVVVENITFAQKNYKDSINTLMATVYHRLAFLYNQIDEIGYGRSGTIFVYDMSNSKIATLCNKHYKNAPYIIDSVCPNRTDIIPESIFNKNMNRLKRASKSIIVYPYNNQKGVPTLGAEETPKFLYESFGHPISVIFNDAYYRNIRLISFKLYKNGIEVPTKLVTKNNDINNKIRKGTFVLVPINRLSSKTTYKVTLEAKADGKFINKSWRWTTR